MANLLQMSICLDEIPNGIVENSYQGKNGKTYFNATVVERKEVGKYGDTHFIKVSRKKDNGEWEDTIIGHLRPIERKAKSEAKVEKPQEQPAPFPTTESTSTNDDLPF